ncbi:hypothetical protein MMC13_004110 [Lambiella insularis]|nr:hypothetical protein [Lambiella insularis]
MYISSSFAGALLLAPALGSLYPRDLHHERRDFLEARDLYYDTLYARDVYPRVVAHTVHAPVSHAAVHAPASHAVHSTTTKKAPKKKTGPSTSRLLMENGGSLMGGAGTLLQGVDGMVGNIENHVKRSAYRAPKVAVKSSSHSSSHSASTGSSRKSNAGATAKHVTGNVLKKGPGALNTAANVVNGLGTAAQFANSQSGGQQGGQQPSLLQKAEKFFRVRDLDGDSVIYQRDLDFEERDLDFEERDLDFEERDLDFEERDLDLEERDLADFESLYERGLDAGLEDFYEY